MKSKYELPSFIEVYELEQQRKKKSRRTIVKVVAIISVIWIVLIIALTSNVKKPKTKNKSLAKTEADQSNEEHPAYSYEILNEEGDANTFQNFNVLINSPDLSEETIKTIAFGLKDTLCKGRCNIALYMSQRSYLMDKEFEKAKENIGLERANGNLSMKQYKAALAKCDRKYYVAVADGLIGLITIDSDDFDYYPYRDGHYQELGGKGAAPKISKIKASDEKGATKTPQLSNSEREEKIRHLFSGWDGSVIKLVFYVKHHMNDSDSFEHIETTYSDRGDYLVVVMKFRGKNSFGAKVINYIKAKVSLDGEVIEII